MFETVFLTLGLLLGSLSLVGLCLWLYSRKYSHLPGELGSPVLGNFRLVVESFMTNTSSVESFSANEVLRVMPSSSKCLPTDWHSFRRWCMVLCNHPAASNKEPLIYDKYKAEFSIGAFSTSKTDSPECKYYRKVYGISMTRKKIEENHKIFVKRSMEFLSALENQKGEFNIYPYTYLFSADTILDMHFGLPQDFVKRNDIVFYENIMRSKKNIINAMTNTIRFVLPPKKVPVTRLTHSFLDKCVDEIRKKIIDNGPSSETDNYRLAEVLIKESLENNRSLEYMHYEVREIFSVGSVTSTEVITAALLFLAMYSEVQQKAWEEQEKIFSGSNRLPSCDDIGNMTYLDRKLNLQDWGSVEDYLFVSWPTDQNFYLLAVERVIKEATRMSAAPLTSRRIQEEISIGDLRLPKNSTVIILSHRMMMNPKYIQNPVNFNPDNFLPENIAMRPRALTYTFGLAPRICPGAHFATYQSKVLISTILRNFKLYSTKNPEKVEFFPGFLMEVKGPYNISLERRKN